MTPDAPDMLELIPLEIDPRPCEHCGLKIDRHRCVDADEGPEFVCLPADEMDTDELELRAELTRQLEVAEIVRDMELSDPRDRWRHTGELPPNVVELRPSSRRKPRVPQSTIDAFKYVVSLDDAEYLAKWLKDHADVAADLLGEVAQC